MSLYYRNLKRIGIGVILVSLGNLVYELLIRHYASQKRTHGRPWQTKEASAQRAVREAEATRVC